MRKDRYAKIAASVRQMLPAKGMSTVAKLMGVKYNTVRGWFTGHQGYDTTKLEEAVTVSLDVIRKDAESKIAFVEMVEKRLKEHSLKVEQE